MSVELQLQLALLQRQRSLDPLVLAVQQLRVVRQTLVVTDVLVQGVAIVTCQTTRDNEHGCDWPAAVT